jgi:hypothetical protein
MPAQKGVGVIASTAAGGCGSDGRTYRLSQDSATYTHYTVNESYGLVDIRGYHSDPPVTQS